MDFKPLASHVTRIGEREDALAEEGEDELAGEEEEAPDGEETAADWMMI